MVPSGASTGIHEAVELRDKAKEYGGKGTYQTADLLTWSKGKEELIF